MSETDLSRNVRAKLEVLGVWCIRIQSGRFKGGRVRGAENGTPDILCLATGITWWIETKATTRPSEDQLKWHNRARRLGHRVYVVRSTDEAIAAAKMEMGIQ